MIKSISIFIEDSRGGNQKTMYADDLMESSSTIKIPLLAMALQKLSADGLNLDDQLPRLPHHASTGSGILNWTAASEYSFKDLLSTLVIYSDCLAANMLIDFVGGQSALNNWLAGQGFKTKLLIPYFHFSDQKGQMPVVGSTTAREMVQLFELLEDEINLSEQPVKYLLEQSLTHINESWFELALAKPLTGLRHKTGSMIDCGPHGETVYNAAGSYRAGKHKFHFCVLSHGFLRPGKDEMSSDNLRKQVASAFSKQTAC